MSATPKHGARCAALDDFLEERQADGYVIETRTPLQAIIVRHHRLYFVMRWFGRGRERRRLVVSVDEDGAVTSVRAEPRRW